MPGGVFVSECRWSHTPAVIMDGLLISMKHLSKCAAVIKITSLNVKSYCFINLCLNFIFSFVLLIINNCRALWGDIDAAQH